MGNESVLCPVCQRVLPASGKESYTPLRGRLIVTNGYCAGGCAERAEQTQQTQQMVRPQAAPSPAPVPNHGHGRQPVQPPVQAPMQGAGRAPLRVVR
ncbi:hypothetical protein HD597_004317 [Nonomuraea thailandensis]|uniref:Uncharacterized protein n=1 Tax=Nonomuraea thailandensis TaxID=1188745 RepID=A0A9X2GGL5_9ACTN|nr:hypothetical protein [Nonomuraea thailandensis]MCP2357297.1 hypothetical protein [Nonomuraea thailandensis]